MELKEKISLALQRENARYGRENGIEATYESLAEAVMAVLREQEPVGEVKTVFMKSGERDTYAINIDSRLNVGDKLYAAPVPPDVLDEIGSLLGVGTAARTMEIIRANIENMKRRSDCLRAVEWEFFTVKKTYDEGDCEPGDEGTEYDECLLNWGADPAEYLEQFRALLAGLKSAPADRDRWHIESLTAEIKQKDEQLAELKDKQFARFANEDCWIFQGDGSDNLESLACPVVISPVKLRELLASLAPHTESAVPDGWKLVPVDPTPEMHKAGIDDWYRNFTQTTLWAAMLAAAPKPEGE